MVWKLFPFALRVIPWDKLAPFAKEIAKEALKYYNESKKNQKQQAELFKDIATQLETLTNAINVLRSTVLLALVLSVVAIILSIISFILN